MCNLQKHFFGFSVGLFCFFQMISCQEFFNVQPQSVYKAKPTPEVRRFCDNYKPKVGRVAFCEDFSNIEEGNIPKGWVGGDNLAVQISNATKVLSPFKPQNSYIFAIPEWKFSGDFRIIWAFQTFNSSDTNYTLSVGHVNVTLYTDQGNFPRSKLIMNEGIVSLGEWKDGFVYLMLTRQENVYKLFLNMNQMPIARYDKVESVEGLAFKVENEKGHYEPCDNFELIGIYAEGFPLSSL